MLLSSQVQNLLFSRMTTIEEDLRQKWFEKEDLEKLESRKESFFVRAIDIIFTILFPSSIERMEPNLVICLVL